MNFPLTDKSAVTKAIVDVSLRSAKAKEIEIFELGNLNDLLSRFDAERLRAQFVKHNTSIKQISNHRRFTSWTENAELVEQNLRVKYVSADNFLIENEILIFDDTVAIYRLDPDPYYLEISDQRYAKQMSSLFNNTWQTGDSLLLSHDGSTLSKQYLPLTSAYEDIPIVIYPAKDDGVLERVFSRTDQGSIERYVKELIHEYSGMYMDANMIIAYVWNQDSTPCADIWKVSRNDISDDSGLLYDAHVYEGHTKTTALGIASGNSSIVVTAEEMLLRDLVLQSGLSFSQAADRAKYSARFPVGYVPDESFYQPLSV